MRSKLSTITIGWYKTATFDLIRHAKRRDTFPSRGRLWPVRIGSPYRPSSGRFAATFPQGKASLRRTARFYVVQLYTPSGCPKGQPPPPTRREAYATLFLRIEFERAGHAAAPTMLRRKCISSEKRPGENT